MKKWRGALCSLLICCMVISMQPVTAWAAEDNDDDSDDTENSDETTINSGACGNNLTWTMEDDALTISGTGAMTVYSAASAVPWYNYRESIESVTIESDVTSIGNYAFYDCTDLTEVTIPNSVIGIGDYAFYNCAKLMDVYYDGKESDKDAIEISGTGNVDLVQAAWHCTESSSDDDRPTTPITYTVTFDSQGGSNMPVQTVASGNEVSEPDEPTREGYAFGGWYTDSTCATAYDFDTEVTENLTLYAKWIAEEKVSIFLTPDRVSIANGTTNPSVVITSNAPLDAEEVTALNNYTVRTGTTGLMLTSAVLGSSGAASQTAGNMQFMLSFSGTAQEGTLTVTVDSDIFNQDAGGDGFDYDATCSFSLTVPAASGGSREGTETDRVIPATPETVISPEVPVVESPLQGIVRQDTDEMLVDWAERVEFPEYAADLYDIMVSGSDEKSSLSDCFLQDDYYTVDSDAMADMPELWDDVDVEEVAFDLSAFYADGSGALGSAVFSDDSFLNVGTSSSDKAVDYPALVPGDIVQTASFNGVFVTKVQRGDTWEQDKIDAVSYIAAVYQAFDRDHPEVFWLSGSSKARVITVKGVAYFFLILANEDGFTMRAPGWTTAGAVATGIQRRDAAIAAILSTVTGETDYEKVIQLNQWLTQHNEYNRSADLKTVGNEPHECLSALEGREGANGPVCEGYARALKVLCNQLGISCVLESGYARVTADSAGEAHMWNLVQIGENWYGADITWDDPIVVNKTGALSGYENKEYLLVGSSTEIGGLTFAYSHPATNQAAEGGVMFTNGPNISLNAYGVDAVVSPFTDVSSSAYYYNAVQWAVNQGITTGKTATTFDPDGSCTRAQMVTFLWRYAGEPEPQSSVNPFTDVASAMYYYKAVLWAVEQGVTNGTSDTTFEPDKAVTRAQTVTFLYRYADEPAVSSSDSFTDVGSGKYFTDAIQWAVANNITTGYDDSTFRPYSNCTRAQIVTFMYRDFA